MSEEKYLICKCPQPDCQKKFKIKQPAKGGIFKITCPHCQKPMSIKFNQGNQPQEQTRQQQSETIDNSSKEIIQAEGNFKIGVKYEISCPHCHSVKIGYTPQAVGKKGIACPKCHGKIAVEAEVDKESLIDENFIVGTSYDITCPNCNNKISGYTPTKDGIETFNCTKCNKIISLKAKKPTQVINVSMRLNSIKGKLQLLRKWGFNKDIPLNVGENTIGRTDNEIPSTIQIDNDPGMSRRSVKIDVTLNERGYSFKLTVLKATNPVLHNNMRLNEGESVSLNYGDSIQLGRTQFRFVKA